MSRKFKINKDDTRVGNFVYHIERDAVKVSDINDVVSHRISTYTTKGQFILGAIKEKQTEWLEAYAVVMFNVLCCVTDEQFLNDVNKATVDCIGRHPQLYGLKSDIDKVEDDKILQNEKEVHDAVETLKEGAE